MRKYTNQQLIESINQSDSIRSTLFKLGLNPSGGNYASIHKIIKELDIDITHFKGKSVNKGKYFGPKKPLKDYLILSDQYQPIINSNKLKKRLILEGIKYHVCEMCGTREWLNQKVPLEIHHINGNKYDNQIENLQILCPNCHTLTKNYRGKNKVRAIQNKINIENEEKLIIFTYYCIECNEKIRKNKSGLCRNCLSNRNRIVKIRPDKNTLLKMISDTSYSAVGRMYGVSDNAIRKWLKKM